MRSRVTAMFALVAGVAWSASPALWPAGGAIAGAQQADAAATVGMIAYVGDNPDHNRSEIFTIRTDGSHRRQLTTTGGNEPAWSPDGSRIAYVWEHRIGVMAANGTGKEWVTRGSSPTWSPDGQALAYSCASSGSLCVLDLETQEETVLVSRTRNWPYVGSMDWSPDGSWIAFTRTSSDGDDYTNYRQLFRVRPDGTDLVAIPNTFSEGTTPSWSPDSTTLMYTERYDGRGGEGSGDLWTIRSDGTGQTQVTSLTGRDDDAAWSPSGLRIAYYSVAGYQPHKGGIWTMTPDGAERDFVVHGGEDPDWRPGFVRTPAAPQPPAQMQGRRIAFVAASDAGFDLFTSRPDGAGIRRLTSGGEAREPAWSPDHTRIAYTGPAIRVMDVDSGESERIARASYVDGLAWSPSGRSLVWGTFRALVVLDLITGDRHKIHVRRGCCSRDPSWSPDGRWLAFSQESGVGSTNIMVVRTTGGQPRVVTRLPGEETQLDWSPDGLRILFTHEYGPWTQRTVTVMSMRPDGSRMRELVDTDALDFSPSWSDTGRRFAMYSDGPHPCGATPRPGVWMAGRQGDDPHLVVQDRTITYVDW